MWHLHSKQANKLQLTNIEIRKSCTMLSAAIGLSSSKRLFLSRQRLVRLTECLSAHVEHAKIFACSLHSNCTILQAINAVV